jgi:hypothetical protein
MGLFGQSSGNPTTPSTRPTAPFGSRRESRVFAFPHFRQRPSRATGAGRSVDRRTEESSRNKMGVQKMQEMQKFARRASDVRVRIVHSQNQIRLRKLRKLRKPPSATAWRHRPSWPTAMPVAGTHT